MHRNNFDVIRLIAALLVICGHQMQLRQFPVPGPLGVPISKTGLDLFFSLSGYLVTDSWERAPQFRVFMRKRALRIFPALIVVVSMTALFYGPMLTSFSVPAYFGRMETWGYLLNAALYLHSGLPGVFGGAPVNGSLWSLFPEFLCYLAVPLAGLLPRLPRATCLAASAALSASVGFHLVATTAREIPLLGNDLRMMLVEMCFFFAGSMFRVVDRGQQGLYRADIVLLLCMLRAFLGHYDNRIGLALDCFALPYLLICFGRLCLPGIAGVFRFGDVSYGLYLYAFPIQRLLTWYDVRYSFPLSLGIAALLAHLSWHLIERPALRLKLARIGGGAAAGVNRAT